MSEEERETFRIRDHIGVISGIVLGAIAFAFVALLAFLGNEPALTLLVVVLVGLALIAIGTRMRG